MSMLAHSIVAPFSQISLCLNCDCVTDAIGDRCPHCGYRGLMNLKKAFTVIRHQHLFDSEHGIEQEQHASYLRCRCGERLEIRLEEGVLL
jgi:DNA-directed RNA polymerase subunit RPC12/RpoP